MSSIAMANSGCDGAGAAAARRRPSRRIALLHHPSLSAFLRSAMWIAGALFQTVPLRTGDTVYSGWASSPGRRWGFWRDPRLLYSSLLCSARHEFAAALAIGSAGLLTTVLGYLFSIPLPRALGAGTLLGAAGLTAVAGSREVEMPAMRCPAERAESAGPCCRWRMSRSSGGFRGRRRRESRGA